MSATTATTELSMERGWAPVDVPRSRTVVAVVVEWRDRVLLLRRSERVRHDKGRWHCVTGYLDHGASPEQQALVELHEETGLGVCALDSLEERGILNIPDAAGRMWRVHTFRVSTRQRRLRLDDEHDAYRWVAPQAVRRFGNRVTWLDEVLALSGTEAAHRAPSSREASRGR
ncbi:NUDIX domain-containing protein [Nocardioides sp. YR527]|uniref:NUDIX domain-containing protein n=1 Tax=Nocardioides sp. YR527 TaxID=1881028 RepID=UPI000B886A84